jgi:hypothetical protein
LKGERNKGTKFYASLILAWLLGVMIYIKGMYYFNKEESKNKI